MTTKIGNYMIYKMYNKELDHSTTEFFLPDDCLKRKLDRRASLQAMKDCGYEVIGILHVDKESYLNARINDTVEEYLELNKSVDRVKSDYYRGNITRDCYLDTLMLIKSSKWTLLRKLDMQIRRVKNEEFFVWNKTALELHEQFLQEIL